MDHDEQSLSGAALHALDRTMADDELSPGATLDADDDHSSPGAALQDGAIDDDQSPPSFGVDDTINIDEPVSEESV